MQPLTIFWTQKLALDRLRANRNTLTNKEQPSASSSAIMQHSVVQPNLPVPPPQSRDATIRSQFFPTTPSLGNVLVPNSSPTTQEEYSTLQYTPYNPLAGHNVASPIPAPFNGGWGQSKLGAGFDLLSAPSGFINHGATYNASSRRRANGNVDSEHHEGPPRKKINRGPSDNIFVVPESPPSPEIHRPAQRRTISAIGLDNMSLSSDESMLDSPGSMAGLSRSRLTKDRPNHPSDANSGVDPNSDREYITFKYSHPTESSARVQAAWNQAARDEKKATAFLLDPAWSPPYVHFSTPATPKDTSSRVKEIDDATKAQRAAEREKGKKSMIYANRSILNTQIPSTPSPTKALTIPDSPVSTSLASPLTPIIMAPSRKRAKKLVVVDSEDEAESDESEDDQNKLESINERRALEYLNSSDVEALQELTGKQFLVMHYWLLMLFLPGCTVEQAETIINLRPFTSGDDLREKLIQGRKKAGPTGISPRMFEDCVDMFREYGSVDNVLEDCEQIGAKIRSTIASWGPSNNCPSSEDGVVSLLSLDSIKDKKNYLSSQPKLLSDTVTLKEYQLLGVNWLNLLYRDRLSGILADEMGVYC